MLSPVQAAFKSVAEEQQHIAGPAHRKALARQQAEQEQKERVARGKGAADSAVVSFLAPCASYFIPACPHLKLATVALQHTAFMNTYQRHYASTN